MTGDNPLDNLREECGVFGVWGVEDATAFAVLGLHALQHRGQEGVGIISHDGAEFYGHHRIGLVADVFSAEENAVSRLAGHAALGHVRYSTAGSAGDVNLQPFLQRTRRGQVALAHNGNLTNADAMRARILDSGGVFQSDSDSEVILHLIARSAADGGLAVIADALASVQGAYSLGVMTDEGLFGVRDPHGVRPLVIGRIGQGWVLASETCALDAVGADFVRDVAPGEIVRLNADGIESRMLGIEAPPRFCVFEYIYFMRPNSQFDNRHAASVRERIGAQLFRESHEPTDIIVPVPESGIHSAVGYAQAAALPFKWAILKSPYVGRTFIEPHQSIRNFGVRLKLSVDRTAVAGRRVTLVDDSIVRSTTMRKLVELVRGAGASEVHVRISSPPFRFPCFYGIDTPRREELVAATRDTEAICDIIGADSLAYISLEGLARAVGPRGAKGAYCHACFSGAYDVPLIDTRMREAVEGTGATIA